MSFQCSRIYALGRSYRSERSEYRENRGGDKRRLEECKNMEAVNTPAVGHGLAFKPYNRQYRGKQGCLQDLEGSWLNSCNWWGENAERSLPCWNKKGTVQNSSLFITSQHPNPRYDTVAADTYLMSEERKKDGGGEPVSQNPGILCQHSLLWSDGLPQSNWSNSIGGVCRMTWWVQESVLS